MDIKLSFLGAAQNVTGSRYLIEANGRRLLVDCGLYQEREFKSRNWDPFPIPPRSIDAVLLTHAHLDHSGLLPKLVREGFEGPIYCTEATAEIAQILLLDEPTTYLDSASRSEIMEIIHSVHHQRGLTTLFVSHDPHLVEQYSDKTYLLEGGKSYLTWSKE